MSLEVTYAMIMVHLLPGQTLTQRMAGSTTVKADQLGFQEVIFPESRAVLEKGGPGVPEQIEHRLKPCGSFSFRSGRLGASLAPPVATAVT